MKGKSLSRVRLFATPWTAAYQAPPSMGFSRQEHWRGCHCLLQCMKVKVKSLSHVRLSPVRLLSTPWTAAHQAPLSMEFSRQEYWSGLPFPSQLLSCGQFFVTQSTAVHQVPLSMEFPRQEYWSGVPFPTPGDLPDPGIETHVSYVSCIGRWVIYHCITCILIKAEIYLSQLWI